MGSIGNISASNFLICDDNDIYFVGALNIIRTLDVEHNFQHFPMIRDGLFPAYAIAKDTISYVMRMEITNHRDCVQRKRKEKYLS